MAESGGNFFANLIARFFESRDPEAIKKRKLKAIAKNLSKSKFNKFYKYGSGEALPALAKFYYNFYKTLASSQTMLRVMQNENAIQRMVIDFFMSEKQKKLQELLSESSIREKAKQIPIKKLAAQAKDALEQFCLEFTNDKINAIENLYQEFVVFRDLCLYDYYVVLRKFDSNFRENDFTSPTDFNKINADYISDDLRDFVAVAWAVPLDADWSVLPKMLKERTGREPINAATLKKLIVQLSALRTAKSLEMMIQLITKNPDYVPVVKSSKTSIADPFIENFKGEVLSVLRQIENEQKSSKMHELAKLVFEKDVSGYMKHYTAEMSETLEMKNLDPLEYVEAMEYLKAFLLEFVKTNVRQYCELMLVRGQWTATAVLKSASNAYNDLLAVCDTITSFDRNLAEDGSVGVKIKTLLPRVAREKDPRHIVNMLVSDANDLARDYIESSTKNLITIGKTIKLLIEDEGKATPEVIMNWPELKRFAEDPPKETGTFVYKKIYDFTQLMQTCVGSN